MNEFFEEERHRCEVRQVIKWRMQDRTKAIDYILSVRNKRGDSAVRSASAIWFARDLAHLSNSLSDASSSQCRYSDIN